MQLRDSFEALIESLRKGRLTARRIPFRSRAGFGWPVEKEEQSSFQVKLESLILAQSERWRRA